MSLIAIWLSDRRRAQHPPDPRYPLGICRWRVLGRQYGARCQAAHNRDYRRVRTFPRLYLLSGSEIGDVRFCQVPKLPLKRPP
jgi:hypothetical protein